MPISTSFNRPAFSLVIQLTDSHLFAQENATLMGLDTAESLRQVVALVQREQPKMDLLLATGDLAQDGSFTAYERFLELTAPLQAPLRWLAGNHDDVPTLRGVSQDRSLAHAQAELGRWRILLLDSTVVGQVAGFLAKSELGRLEQSLINYPDKHHLICLHHHPVPIGCAWMAGIGLHNAADFFAIIERYSNVKAVLWGHVHQAFDQVKDGVRLLASPSTCVQFAPGSDAFKVSDEAPGYRWLRLYDDGTIETGISRTTEYVFNLDTHSSGY